SLLYAKINKKPLVVTYHGDIIPSYNDFIYQTSVQVYNMIVKEVLKYADIIIIPSRYYVSESLFLKDYKDKIVEIPNGINYQNFEVSYSKEECRRKLGLPIDKKIILYLGVLHPKKGLDILLKAMPKIVAEIPDSELVIAGDGIMRRKLEELSEKLGVKDHVNFAGFVPENLKPLYYNSADIFCLPSRMSTEVFPVVLLEASASGLPMVVSDLNTLKCIIEHGYNGIITKRGDENEIAQAIISLLEDENLRRKMSKNAKRKVKYYHWSKITKKYEDLYYTLINR
ncbi:MAG TPA: glycosyltransferase family 1 protein, partial [Pyrodictium sp.]|nr:glycosyltransferase family 1 protein [Pyrodictium sp.]